MYGMQNAHALYWPTNKQCSTAAPAHQGGRSCTAWPLTHRVVHEGRFLVRVIQLRYVSLAIFTGAHSASEGDAVGGRGYEGL